MKKGFYRRIALTGINRNRKLYVPYIITCIGMVMMYYIISSLSASELLEHVSGGRTAKSMLDLGSRIIFIFSLVFLFYSNSFLVRRRKKEFGLYNILGMSKKNVSIVLLWETAITAFISLLAGVFLGIAFSKLAELLLINMLNGDVAYSFSVSMPSVKNSLLLFGLIFLLIFLNGLRQVHLANPIALLHSENVGEKPPKGNILWGFGGVVILAAAYYIALSIKNPLSALVHFYAAVIMVIAATYLIFISGSVVLCRLLQKAKGYYYKPDHFVPVAQMKYRMKRNGAGLASICILSTMVLVMITSSSCLYFGKEKSLREIYPHSINLTVILNSMEYTSDENIGRMRNSLQTLLAENSSDIDNVSDYRIANIAGCLYDDKMEVDAKALESFGTDTFDKLVNLYFMPLSDYNRICSTDEQLAENEAIIYCCRMDYGYESLTVKNGMTLNIVKKTGSFPEKDFATTEIIPYMVIVVPDFEKTVAPLTEFKEGEDDMLTLKWEYCLDVLGDKQQEHFICEKIRQKTDEFVRETDSEKNAYGIYYTNLDSRAESRDEFYGLYGGLFFLGILLSLVFISATVLIIYYKQVSEGYEDRSRFEIMQKVGMTKSEIKKNINSQMLLVFFLPLGFAIMHLGFAFPIIRKLLLLFSLDNFNLFITTTCLSILVFAIFYTLTYKATGNAYYRIVSEKK